MSGRNTDSEFDLLNVVKQRTLVLPSLKHWIIYTYIDSHKQCVPWLAFQWLKSSRSCSYTYTQANKKPIRPNASEVVTLRATVRCYWCRMVYSTHIRKLATARHLARSLSLVRLFSSFSLAYFSVHLNANTHTNTCTITHAHISTTIYSALSSIVPVIKFYFFLCVTHNICYWCCY